MDSVVGVMPVLKRGHTVGQDLTALRKVENVEGMVSYGGVFEKKQAGDELESSLESSKKLMERWTVSSIRISVDCQTTDAQQACAQRLSVSVFDCNAHGVFVNRTIEVKDPVFQLFSVDSWDDVTPEMLENVVELYLNNQQIESLEKNDLDGFVNLELLALDDNQLETLPKGIFDCMPKLRRLYLQKNHIETLPVGLFEKQVDLECLFLSGNRIATLPVGVFDGLYSLKNLHLDHNQISELLIDVFRDLIHLQLLFLSKNRMVKLCKGVFGDLNRLQTLELDENYLEELELGVFDSLVHLEWLDLHNNRLRGLTDGILDPLVRLRRLYLNGNRIERFSDHSFDYNFDLSHLHVYGNPLMISKSLFRNFQMRPTNFSLGYHRFSSMPEVFVETSSLRIPLLEARCFFVSGKDISSIEYIFPSKVVCTDFLFNLSLKQDAFLKTFF